MKVDIINGKLNLFCDDGTIVSDITAVLQYEGDHYDILSENNSAWTVETSREEYVKVRGGAFTLEFESVNGITYVRGGYTAQHDVKRVTDCCFFKGKTNRTFKSAYVNGHGYVNGVAMNDMSANVDVIALVKNQHEQSFDFCAAEYDGAHLLFGTATFKQDFAVVEFCQNGGISMYLLRQGQTLKKGESMTSDSFFITSCNGLNAALNKYADIVAENCGVSVKQERQEISGWCSWYYYGSGITEKCILENTEQLKTRKIPVQYVQVDDGWSTNRGDWVENEKFPHGMKWLADKIKEAGYLPGIWVAPFTAEESSDFYREDNDLLVKGEDGKPIGYPTIDYSRQEACDYLYNLFHRLSHEWGYRYIKFDFAVFAISSGKYSDPTFNGVKNYRKALEIIRSAVTEDTFLLACSSPMYAPIGLADGVRISKDIFERWTSVKEIAAHILHRNYLVKYIGVDPDCALTRFAENEDGECFRLCTRTAEENDVLLALIGVSGGSVMISDKLSLLSDEQIEKFKYLLPVNRKAGVPVDIETTDVPSIVDCGIQQGIRTIVFFNWEDYSQEMSFSLGEPQKVFDFWNKKAVGTCRELKELLAPHTCKVYQCTGDDQIVIGCHNRMIPSVKIQASEGEIYFAELKEGETLLLALNGNPVCEGGGLVKRQDGTYELTASSNHAYVRLGN